MAVMHCGNQIQTALLFSAMGEENKREKVRKAKKLTAKNINRNVLNKQQSHTSVIGKLYCDLKTSQKLIGKYKISLLAIKRFMLRRKSLQLF